MSGIGRTETGTTGNVGATPEVQADSKPAATTPAEPAGGAPGATATSRPKSVNMQGLDLQRSLEEKLKASTPGATPDPKVAAEPKKDPLGGWKVSASFGPRFEKYDPVNVRIRNERVDVTIEGVEFLQRNSMEYYKFWEAEKAADVFKFIDEPTNQTQIEGQKDGWIIGVRAYHPKMLVSLGGDGQKNLNESVHVKGTIEGKPVDGPMNLKDTFGAIHLTHKLMNFEAYAGKQFTLAEGKAGKLTLDAALGGGIYTGRVRVNYRDPKDYWSYISYDESKSKVIGGSVTMKNTLTYMLSGGHVGFGAEVDITRGKMNYDMMGGKTSHDVKSESFAVFVKLEF